MDANQQGHAKSEMATHIKFKAGFVLRKALPASLVVLGFVAVSLLGRGVADWVISIQSATQMNADRTTDERLESQSRWLSEATESALKKALQDAQDVGISEGRHLPRAPGLLGVALIRGGQLQWVWSEAVRPQILAARVGTVESLRKELLLAFSQTGASQTESEVEVLPLSTPPVHAPRSSTAADSGATRWLAVSTAIKSSEAPVGVAPMAPAKTNEMGGAVREGEGEGARPSAPARTVSSAPTVQESPRVVALFDPSQGVAEISDVRERSLGGRFRARLVDAESFAILASSELTDFSSRFRSLPVGRAPTGGGNTVPVSAAGWIPGSELRSVLRDFISLGRVSALGTYDKNRVRLQRVNGFPLVVMAEMGTPLMPVAGVGTSSRVSPSTLGLASFFLFVGVTLVCAAVFLLYRKLRERSRISFQQKMEILQGDAAASIEAIGQEGVAVTSSGAIDSPGGQPSEVLEVEPLDALLQSSAMGDGAELAGPPVFAYQPARAPVSEPSISIQVPENFEGEFERLRSENQSLKKTCDHLERALNATKERLELLQEEDRLLAEFETGSLIQRRPRLIAEQAVKTATQLCGTPSLFFTLDSKKGVAVLTSEAGLKEGGMLSPATLEFQLNQAAESEIGKITQEGAIASLSEYEPLSQLLLRTFGVSHFEAWAVTGYSWLGRAASKPKVLGVLVLLQSGSQTLTHHRSLGRMVRNAGLVYENSLLSQ